MAALVRFPKCQQAYLWCRVTGCGPSLAAFHFAPSRSREVAELLLGDYSGTVIRDSYTGYETLENCDVACCWAHARRYFVTAFDNGFGKAEEPLKLIRALYRIECEAKRKAEAKGHGDGAVPIPQGGTPGIAEARWTVLRLLPDVEWRKTSVIAGRQSGELRTQH